MTRSRPRRASSGHIVIEAYMALLARTAGPAQERAAAETFRLAEAIRGRSVQKALSAASTRMVANVAALSELARRELSHPRLCHGLIPGEFNGLAQPALALTAPDVADIDGDGLLTMSEILGLKLDADWVVLSACNTASGAGAGAAAASGLGILLCRQPCAAGDQLERAVSLRA